MPGRPGLAHQNITWIRNQRRTGIGDQSHIAPGLKFSQNPGGAILFVVIMERDHSLLYTQMAQQPTTVPRIFGSHHIYTGQRPGCPWRQIIKIADGRGNDIKRATRLTLAAI